MEYAVLLIKPASSLCNMNCRYCFYRSLSEKREQSSYGCMNADTASRIIDEAFRVARRGVNFAFQGGEPTLAGLDFFRAFVQTAEVRRPRGLEIAYSIQTNGLLVDADWAQFFKQHRFLVGLSLDGPKELHDYLRQDGKGNGTFARVMKTARLLEKHRVDFNILTVVSAGVARHAEKVYRFFKSQGFSYLQFIPCLDPLDQPPFGNEQSLTPALYGAFLKRLFMLYYEDFMADRYVSIRFFDNLVRVMQGLPSEQCGMHGACSGQIVIEGDGTVYPCDFYCVDRWRLGNIHEQPLDELLGCDTMRAFIASSEHRDPQCAACDVAFLCRGGCRRDRDPHTDGRAGENVYCGVLREFYRYAAPLLAEMVARLRRQGGLS